MSSTFPRRRFLQATASSLLLAHSRELFAADAAPTPAPKWLPLFDGKTLTGIAVRTERWRYAEYVLGGPMLLDMENDPHQLIEGILIAGRAIDSHKGYIYIRGEYRY